MAVLFSVLAVARVSGAVETVRDEPEGAGSWPTILPVTLEDRTGLVQAFGPAQPGQFNLFDGVKADANPTVLVVSWVGGLCDRGDAPGVRCGERRVLGHGDDRARSRLSGRERAPDRLDRSDLADRRLHRDVVPLGRTFR